MDQNAGLSSDSDFVKWVRQVLTDLVSSLGVLPQYCGWPWGAGGGDKELRSWTEEKIKVRCTLFTTTNVSHWCHDLHCLVKWRPARITMVMRPLKTAREMSHTHSAGPHNNQLMCSYQQGLMEKSVTNNSWSRRHFVQSAPV